ncbi:MAG: hypothetical protein HQK54_17730 [Oligoflexales bacterium]|nr:hypothetical protein [Oligoflexales bacterium]
MKKPGQDDTRIPLIYLEKWLLDELDESRKNGLLKRYGRQRIEEELEILRSSNREIEKRFITSEAISKIRSYSHGTTDSSKRKANLKPVLFSILAAAALALTIYPLVLVEDDGQLTRIKGDASAFVIYKKEGDKIVKLKPGDTCYEGDQIQITFSKGEEKEILIFSIDGRGNYTEHFSKSYARENSAGKRETVRLDYSYKLDDAPLFERFYLIRSDKKIERDKIRSLVLQLVKEGGIEKTETLPLEDNLMQSTILLKKGKR